MQETSFQTNLSLINLINLLTHKEWSQCKTSYSHSQQIVFNERCFLQYSSRSADGEAQEMQKKVQVTFTHLIFGISLKHETLPCS